MNTQGQNVNTKSGAYSAYYNRPKPFIEQRLAKVGPGTPTGEYLRRYWHPIILSSEIKDVPVKIRILGEDLVIFRDKSGDLGLLHKACLHRGASLEFGIPQEHGIRCSYHGWQFGVDGTVLETPAEPPTSRIKTTFCQGAYPVHEKHGLIFAYMGPPEAIPPFPDYDTDIHPAPNELVPFKVEYACNWLQIIENACDPIHNAYLHAIVAGQQFSPAFAIPPALDFIESPLGFVVVATRKVKDSVFIRAADIILPNIAQFTGAENTGDKEVFGITTFMTRWVTPVDDEKSYYLGFMHLNQFTNPAGVIKPEFFGVGKMGLIGQTDDRPYTERQREPGDYDAVVSQGGIANRRAEHLGVTDRGIITFRRMVDGAITAVERGETPAIPAPTNGALVRTYCHELTFPLPKSEAVIDQAKLAAFGRKVYKIVAETTHLSPEEREEVSKERVRDLVATHFAF